MVKKKKKKLLKKAKGSGSAKKTKRKGPSTGPTGVIAGPRIAGKIAGVNARTLQRWAGEGLVTVGRGKYDLRELFEFCQKKLRREIEGEDPEARRANRANAEDKEASARIKKLRADKLEGLLISIEQVNRDNVNKVHAVKAALLHLSISLSRQLEGVIEMGERENIIEGEVIKVLNRFAGEE